MTTALPDRLDCIESALEDLTEQVQTAASDRQELKALVESTAKIAESNAKAIEAAASDRATLRTSIDELATVAGQTLRPIEEMQSEVRGLQLDNRRMLDHLFGQSEDDNGD
jgi:chromosome segregation ATPase